MRIRSEQDIEISALAKIVTVIETADFTYLPSQVFSFKNLRKVEQLFDYW